MRGVARAAPLRMRTTASTALVTSLLLALVGISLAVSEHAQTRAASISASPSRPTARPARSPACSRARVSLSGSWRPTPPSATASWRTAPGAPDAINRALGSLERAEPRLVGAASAIGLDGRERARVVHGETAPAAALARDARSAAFFRATLGTRPGEVHVSQPYRSADTGQWVVSNSVLVRDGRGAPLGIVRFELALASVRAAATAALGRGQDVQVALVDRASGREILDTSRGLLAGGAAGGPVYRGIADAGQARGTLSAGGRRLAFRMLTGVPAGLGWVVVAGSPQPSLLDRSRALPGRPRPAGAGAGAGGGGSRLAAPADPRRGARPAGGRGRARRGRAAFAHGRADGPLQPPPRARRDRRRARALPIARACRRAC